jgi:hypothetical protein
VVPIVLIFPRSTNELFGCLARKEGEGARSATSVSEHVEEQLLGTIGDLHKVNLECGAEGNKETIVVRSVRYIRVSLQKSTKCQSH